MDSELLKQIGQEREQQEMKDELERLRNENEALKAKKVRKLSCKVGKAGGVSVYGVNSRFPVTLYAQQWEKVLNAAPEIKAFIEEHKNELKTKE